MERRVLLAVVLSIGLILLVNILFPPVPAPVQRPAADSVVAVDSPDAAVDTTRAADAPFGGDRDAGGDTGRAGGQRAAAGDSTDRGALARITGEEAPPGDTVRVRTALAEYEFSTRGASLIGARLLEFESYAEEDEEGARVQLVPRGDRFFGYGIAVGRDTVSVANRIFEASSSSLELSSESPRDSVTFTFDFPGQSGARFVVTYRFRYDGYLVEVDGRVEGLQGRGYGLLADLGPGLRSNEQNFDEDHGQYAMVTNGEESGVESVQFGDLEDGEVRPVPGGPFHWVAVKSKYFLAAVVAGGEDGPMFGGATIRGLGPGPRDEQQARVSTSLPVPAGTPGFSFGAYLGPQDYGRLDAIGQDLQDVNSYGYQWLQPVIRPLVAIVMPILVWMHTNFDLAYGWVLILFGVLMRVVLFPLYQKSMRAQIGQMRLQPVVKEIREKYKDDPQKMQQEMMRVYKEEGVNPLAGCLPMLVPMPILFTLFFVFQGTIEFRGVPFLWLPDLSLKDPLYIIPLVMGASMFLLQWIGQRSMDSSNTQMKVMMYAMPVFFTFLFANFPSGLNLYYTTSNLASLPQQLYIARERKAATAAREDGKGDRGGGG